MSRRTIEAEVFVMRDPQGNERARIDCNDQGPYVALFDALRKARAVMGMDHGNPVICLFDADNKPRLQLSLDGQWPRISLLGEEKWATTGLDLTQHEAHLWLCGPSGAPVLYFSAGPKGAGFELLQDVAPQSHVARLTLTPSGPTLTLHAKSGGPRMQLSVAGQKPVLAFLNKKGERTFTLTVTGKRPILRVQRPNKTPALIIPLEELKKP